MTDLIVTSEQTIELGLGAPSSAEVDVTEAFINYNVPQYTGSYSVTPSTSAQTLDTDGKMMTDDVTVSAIPSGSIGSSVSISGNTVTATASVTSEGYVDENTSDTATATIPSGSFADTVLAYREMNRSILSTAGIDAGGYIAANKIKQNHVPVADVLPTQSGVTITPSTVSQIASYAYRWLTGNITVEPIPQEYIVPSGTKSITANGTGIDVSSYQYADVAVPGTTPSGTKSISITSNGTTTHDVSGYASASVTANVPNTYASGDEGKVVSNGALVAQTSDTVTTNDTYDTTLINSLTVNVSGGDLTYDEMADGSKPNGAITLTTATVSTEAFIYRAYLTDVNMPNTTTIGNYAFANCTRLGTVKLPAFTTAASNNYIFSGSGGTSKNAKAILPALTNIGSRMFRNAYFDAVDLGAGCGAISADTFYTTSTATNPRTIVCDKLILRKTGSIVTASTTDSIKGLKDVYVPSALKSTYEGASNWSTKVTQGHITFHSIEGSVYENAYADGTPIT